MPKFGWIKKVIVLGSGAIKIGEAAESFCSWGGGEKGECGARSGL